MQANPAHIPETASAADSQYAYERFIQDQNKRIFTKNQDTVNQLAQRRYLADLEKDATFEEKYIKTHEEQISDNRKRSEKELKDKEQQREETKRILDKQVVEKKQLKAQQKRID